MSHTTEIIMRPGDTLKTSRPIRSQKTGTLLPREGTFVRTVENLGRKLILVNFGTAGDEYLFPEEILAEPVKA
jgi:UDP:flavonoid glycosyltransferase YjiC (YdhE family)